MNILIFNFFFSLSSNALIAWSSLFISNILIYVFIIVAVMIPIIISRDYIYAIITAGAGGAAWVFAYIMKAIILVPRPFVTLHLTPLYMETSSSFPSSHVILTMTLTILVWKLNRKLGIVFLIFTILTAFSRMIIGVHYPTDLLAGACFGLIFGLCAIWFNKFIRGLSIFKKYI